ncbi:MAG TPA: adenylyltransferase/cytidyltransferase family protein [Candidatus Saccharimonadales bacterium]|nr:adenylyltransferase/cytidyltransferase family protein [Candidatus Saccharimonadales bacterium]
MVFIPDLTRRLRAEEKIHSFREMRKIIGELRNRGVTVVLAQGVFDIPHRGHIGYFRAALDIDPSNTLLIVGVENDESVKQNKGLSRPINPLTDRLHMLSEFVSVGLVFAFDDVPTYNAAETFINRYRALEPVSIAVASWDPHRGLKELQAKEAGTSLAFLDYRHENSTTRMLRRVGFKE